MSMRVYVLNCVCMLGKVWSVSWDMAACGFPVCPTSSAVYAARYDRAYVSLGWMQQQQQQQHHPSSSVLPTGDGVLPRGVPDDEKINLSPPLPNSSYSSSDSNSSNSSSSSSNNDCSTYSSGSSSSSRKVGGDGVGLVSVSDLGVGSVASGCLGVGGCLPNKHHPSDHLPISISLALRY
jgi:hypothetical protein